MTAEYLSILPKETGCGNSLRSNWVAIRSPTIVLRFGMVSFSTNHQCKPSSEVEQSLQYERERLAVKVSRTYPEIATEYD